GAVLCVRARRLADDARQILPPEFQPTSPGGRFRSRLLLAASGAYALLLLLFVGGNSYRRSALDFRVEADARRFEADARREGEAGRALDEGVDSLGDGDLEAADRSLQRSLDLWEELTAEHPASGFDRANQAITLNDLGVVRKRQGRLDEAEQYYQRAIDLADE